jgi:hypothetical protein
VGKVWQVAPYTGAWIERLPWYWWLRTPYAGLSYHARTVNEDGTLNNSYANVGIRGVRPALELDSGILVSGVSDTDGAYILIWDPSINLKTKINDSIATYSDGWVKVNGQLGHITDMWIKQNDTLIKI